MLSAGTSSTEMAASTYAHVRPEPRLHRHGGNRGLAGQVGLDSRDATPDEGLTQLKCSRSQRAVAPALPSHAREQHWSPNLDHNWMEHYTTVSIARTCYRTVSDNDIHQKSTVTRHKSGKVLAYLEVLKRPDDGPELLHDRANIKIQDSH